MCYRRGGEEPTLTDANVLLGRLPPHLLGGEVPLDVERARVGLERLATRLGMGALELAAGILEIADWNQVNAIRQVTVKKGLDPRDYVLVPFGGSGPLQAARVAQLLGLQTVVVPPTPGNISAFGLLAVDLKTDYVSTVVQREDRLQVDDLTAAFRRLEGAAERDLAREGVPAARRRYLRTADLRYFGEAYEVRVEMPAGDLGPTTWQEAANRFHTIHEALYGYSYRGSQLTEVVNVRVSGIGLIDKPVLAETRSGYGEAAPSGFREVFFEGGFAERPIYARADLHAGVVVTGPAIVEEYGSTTVVQPGQRVEVDPSGNMLIRLAQA
jgi:N-methylhydantoinase A